MSLAAFQPQGNTILVAASSSTGLAPTQLGTGNVIGAYLVNPSTVSIYVAVGSSLVAASVPTTSTPSAGMCLRSGSDRTFTFSPNGTYNWLSAVTSAGAAAPGLYATPGFGQ